jgi:hypothetical protein
MSKSLEPLDFDVATVVSRAKELDPITQGLAARVYTSVVARMRPSPSGGGATAGSGPVVSPAPPVRTAISLRAVTLAGMSMAVGAGIAAIALRPTTPVERIVYVDRVLPSASAETPSVSTSVAPVETARRPEAIAPSPLGKVEGSSTKPMGESQDRLAAESALLDIARVAAAQGNAQRALEAVERHRRQFPSGLLSEEREALTIKALHLLGRDAEARARAARFGRSYPTSLFLPVIWGMLELRPRPPD